MAAAAAWEPVRLDAEFSPELAALLSTDGWEALLSHSRGRTLASEALRTKVRKHLLALGWRIVSRSQPNAGGLAPRLRYHAPDGGKALYSLPHAINRAGNGKGKATLHDHALGDDMAEPPAPPEDAIVEYNPAPPPEEKAIVEYKPAPPEEDAVAEYINLVVSKVWGQGPRAKQLLAKAKEQLLSSGWSSWTTTRNTGRRDVHFRGPNGGRSYTSLVTACQAYLAETKRAAAASPPRPMIAGVGDCSNDSMVIDPPTDTGAGSGSSKYKRRRSRVSTFFSDYDADTLERFCPDKKKKMKKKKAYARVLKPKDGERQPLLPSAWQQRHARTLLSVLNDRNILARREKLSYKPTMDGPPTKEGLVTGEASLIRCTCGCDKADFTVAEFVAHAGGSSADRPLARLFLKDGRSLSQCLLQIMAEDGKGAVASARSLRPRLKRRCSHEDDDAVCSVCHEYGELLLCDHCPSTFHHACVGLEATPEGDWFCPSCRCSVCHSSHFDPADTDGTRFTDKTIIYCDQCEREHHVGCIRGRGMELDCYPQGPWLCGGDCSKIFQRLQGLVGRSIPTSVEGVWFTVLRSRDGGGEEAMAEQHGKLRVAFDILHECFVTLMEPRTKSDLSEDIVFNREAELRRLNFRGFYMVGIEKGGELITVGTLRVYGNKVAELPLVGTRFVHRRKGMCRLLMNQVEKLLGQLGVERLVLPAVPELVQTWTASFGFQVMGHSDKLDIAEHTVLSFRGTTMCHKFIATTTSNGNGNGNANASSPKQP